jgi:hypothetical protein
MAKESQVTGRHFVAQLSTEFEQDPQKSSNIQAIYSLLLTAASRRPVK